MDVDPSRKAVDFTCGKQTYNGHKGTDFAIRDRATMDRGVDVIAAAAGTVMRIRDGMPDETSLNEHRRQWLVKNNQACGNGVVLDHGSGWRTQYCHLRRGSILVQPGVMVKAGDRLGLVGQSGMAEFPHVHLSVLKDGRYVDPFTGAANDEGCHKPENRLWHDTANPLYQPFSIYAAGFTGGVPDFDRLYLDATPSKYLDSHVATLSFWAMVFGLSQGDQILMEIRDPENRLYAERKILQKKNMARQSYYIGRRSRGVKTGTWTGTIRVIRKTGSVHTIERKLTTSVIAN